jgi:hypothetical protein
VRVIGGAHGSHAVDAMVAVPAPAGGSLDLRARLQDCGGWVCTLTFWMTAGYKVVPMCQRYKVKRACVLVRVLVHGTATECMNKLQLVIKELISYLLYLSSAEFVLITCYKSRFFCTQTQETQ